MRKSIFYFWFSILCFFFSESIYSQTDNINADSLLKVAQQYYNQNENVKSEEICLQILSYAPDYTDVKILLARNYMNVKQFSDAEGILNEVLKNKPNYYDAHAALVDLNYWSKKYEACVLCCNNALNYFPTDSAFLLSKEKCIVESSSRMMRDLNQLNYSIYNNKIAASYRYNYFLDNTDFNSQEAYLEYTRKLNKATVIGRVNYANRFNESDFQFESDLYYKFDMSKYLYLNAGISNNIIYPDYRLGAEYFQALPAQFEVSLGLRYLYFKPDNVFIYTGSLTKYIQKYMLSARVFITPKNSDITASGLFILRHYNTEDNYVGLRLKYGIDPNNSNIDPTTSSRYLMQSRGFEFEYNELIKQRVQLTIYAGYESTEWRPSEYRNAVTAQVVLGYLF